MKSAIRNYALLFAGCVLFHIVGTWSLPLIDRDEPRFAEASREMIERGDYVIPHFNDQFRLDKPPFAYWAQMASYRIFGENDFAARFPSTIAAALVALSIFAWGSRIGGSRGGWWAAIIFTLSLQTFVHAKAAVADMWLVLFVTMAHWAGHELIQRPTPKNSRGRLLNAQRSTLNSETIDQTSNPETVRGRPSAGIEPRTSLWWWIFYISLALGFLAKGPIAWTPLLTVGATMFFAHELRFHRRFKFLRGMLLMLAIVALWGIPALVRTHGQFLSIGIGRHVIGRSFGAMEGHGANSLGVYLLLLPFYFLTIFVSFFPWSVKLPWLVRKLWNERPAAVGARGYNIDNYLIAGIAMIFIIFSLIKTKLPHYTLPALPLLALLLARHWFPQRAASRMAIATACAWLVIALVFPPLVAPSFPASALFQQSGDYLQPEMEFGAVEYTEPSLVWYFRSRVRRFFTPLNRKNALDFMVKAGPRFIVVPSSVASPLLADHPPEWKIFSTRGFNIAKGKHVDLTLVLKPE